MHYTQLFQSLREAQGLTHESLARMAGCHPYTVVNLENGRPVRFKTLAELMSAMGYDEESTELKTIALRWLQSVSGVEIASTQNLDEARRKTKDLTAPVLDAAKALAEAVITQHLTIDQIQTLIFASKRPEMMAVLENLQKLKGASSIRSHAEDSLTGEERKCQSPVLAS